jgi:hypothetical protein
VSEDNSDTAYALVDVGGRLCSQMSKISGRQFGLIVAFLIPGFIGLAGLAPLMPIVGEWLRPVNLGDFGIGPTIYALMAATAVEAPRRRCCPWEDHPTSSPQLTRAIEFGFRRKPAFAVGC